MQAPRTLESARPPHTSAPDPRTRPASPPPLPAHSAAADPAGQPAENTPPSAASNHPPRSRLTRSPINPSSERKTSAKPPHQPPPAAPQRTCTKEVHIRYIRKAAAYKAGPLAQRLEQGTHNPLVGGSNPSGPTNQPTPRYPSLRRRLPKDRQSSTPSVSVRGFKSLGAYQIILVTGVSLIGTAVSMLRGDVMVGSSGKVLPLQCDFFGR
jgi:hypothetical protein